MAGKNELKSQGLQGHVKTNLVNSSIFMIILLLSSLPKNGRWNFVRHFTNAADCLIYLSIYTFSWGLYDDI